MDLCIRIDLQVYKLNDSDCLGALIISYYNLQSTNYSYRYKWTRSTTTVHTLKNDNTVQYYVKADCNNNYHYNKRQYYYSDRIFKNQILYSETCRLNAPSISCKLIGYGFFSTSQNSHDYIKNRLHLVNTITGTNPLLLLLLSLLLNSYFIWIRYYFL